MAADHNLVTRLLSPTITIISSSASPAIEQFDAKPRTCKWPSHLIKVSQLAVLRKYLTNLKPITTFGDNLSEMVSRCSVVTALMGQILNFKVKNNHLNFKLPTQ